MLNIELEILTLQGRFLVIYLLFYEWKMEIIVHQAIIFILWMKKWCSERSAFFKFA
jgi:hypothetical protein